MNVLDRVKFAFSAFRSTLANPTEWFLKMLNFGYKSKAGIDVNTDAAVKIAAVFACCNTIASTIASLPLGIYKRTNKGKEKQYNHNVYELIDSLPNNETTAYEFWTMLVFNLLLTGYGLAKIKRDGNGIIKELLNVPTGNVTIYRNKATNELFYEIKDSEGNKEIVYYENMFVIQGQRFNNDNPMDPIYLARESMGLSLALEEYAENYFENGANVGGIVEYPHKLKDTEFERFKESFYEKYAGLKNSNKIVFLETGGKFTRTSNTPEESQSIEARKYQVIEICRFFNVPPNKVFDFERLTFNNAEQVNINYVQDCIVPMCVRIEQAIKKDLFTISERKKLFAKFTVMGLLRGDVTARKEFYQAGVQNGWFSPNDVREFEDLNRYEGGDTYFINAASIPVDMIREYLKGGDTTNV